MVTNVLVGSINETEKTPSEDATRITATDATPQSGLNPAEDSNTESKSSPCGDESLDGNGNTSDFSAPSTIDLDTFQYPLPAQPCFFVISKSDWQQLRRMQSGRRFHGLQWTNVVAKGLKSVNPYCSFGFKHHCVKTLLSTTKAPLFRCMAYCRFEACPVKAAVTVTDSSLKAVVVFSGGNVCHNTLETKSRPVRADSRKTTASILQTKHPRSVYLESMLSLPPPVVQSGCRDDAVSTGVLKNISWTERQKERPHSDEVTSLQTIIDNLKGTDTEVLQKVMLHPKGIMLWSKKTLSVFYKRCKEDIVYLDATGNIVKKKSKQSPPYYVYELVVRNPSKGSSPLPVATYVTCDHTTASVTYFLQAFQTDLVRLYGHGANKRPVMIICDGSLVLLHSISITFCHTALEDLLTKYYQLITGQYSKTQFDLPILHRCLSHIMRNAKDLCKKQIPAHYKLGMHIFGLLACSSTLEQMDQVLLSATALFNSPCSGPNVEKNYDNLIGLMQEIGTIDLDRTITPENYKHAVGSAPLKSHFQEIIQRAPLDHCGVCNIYYAPGFIPSLEKYFLPHATLWSGLMLGDLGRHGTGPAYTNLSKRYNEVSQTRKQNFTMANRTQGIMEKSQWDLKQIRFQRKSVSRLDDFVTVYQKMHDALLLEYADTELSRKRSHRVEVERWKKGRVGRKGVYVSPLATTLPFKKPEPENRTLTQKKAQEQPTAAPTSGETHRATAESELTTLWRRQKTEVVVSVIPSQIRGNNLIIHHSELCPLVPHQWLTGEIIECLLHLTANQHNLSDTIYIMNHYTAGVIVHDKRELFRRQSLAKINFENYKAIASCVNYNNTHWKFLSWQSLIMQQRNFGNPTSTPLIIPHTIR
ncbi:uncharacterized protein LOC105353816 isoform X2 [Oryzias latipes]|uniref:uncharacterized protein LOC105353816 isoform X2 n=1 Tax=Oryzias latipes TaxID=8090 RepID=UPI0009DA539D|nr:uncharacterized protein LOC105353816 isoform X2 [Oryzias latipes]